MINAAHIYTEWKLWEWEWDLELRLNAASQNVYSTICLLAYIPSQLSWTGEHNIADRM